MKERKTFNIIIADDDEDDQYFLQNALWDLNPNFNIISVNNGTELLDYLLKQGRFINYSEVVPHCIFLDINMPLLNGFDALARIKGYEEFKNIPVHILSTCNHKESKVKAEILGAKGFHTKVCNVDKLKDIVSGILSQIKTVNNFSSENFSVPS